MPQPLTATYRLKIEYVVPNQPHIMRQYCQASPSLAAPSGYYLWDRDGLATIDAALAAQAWWTAFRTQWGAVVLAPTFTLENRVGVVWTPVLTGVLTGAGSNAAGPNYASQFTISCRTDNFQRIRFLLLEQSQYIAAFKYAGYAALHVGSAAVAEAIAGVDANANGLFQWSRSKDNRILNASAPIISSVYDLNDLVRRSRSLQ